MENKKMKRWIAGVILIAMIFIKIEPLAIFAAERPTKTVSSVTINNVKYSLDSTRKTMTIQGTGIITNEWQDKLYKKTNTGGYWDFGEIEKININSENITGCEPDAFILREDLVGELERIDGSPATGMVDLSTVVITKFNKGNWNSDAFKGNTTINNITLQASIKSISEGCFSNMSNLQTVTLNKSSTISEIPKDAFKNCKKLNSVVNLNIMAKLTKIGESAFEKTDLRTVVLGKAVTTIEKAAFKQCPSIQTVTFTKGTAISRIEDEAFAYCGDLSNITTSDNADTIGYLPESITYIGNNAFQMCSSLTRLRFLNKECEIYPNSTTIPSSTTIVGYGDTREDDTTAKSWAEKYNKFYFWSGDEVIYKGGSNYKFSQEFTSSIDGVYLIEAYGAKGGNSIDNAVIKSSGAGANGAYAKLKISLEKGDKLYVSVGSAGTTDAGGWNGGAAGTSLICNEIAGATVFTVSSGGGGGATDVATAPRKKLSELTKETDNRILVAGGGGGGGKSGYQLKWTNGTVSAGGNSWSGLNEQKSNGKIGVGTTGQGKKTRDGAESSNASVDKQPRWDVFGGGGGGYRGGVSIHTGNMSGGSYKGTSYAATGIVAVQNGDSTRNAEIIEGTTSVKGGSSGNGSCVFTVDELAHYEINYHSNHYCDDEEDFVHSEWFKEGNVISIIALPTQLKAFESPKECSDGTCSFLGWNTEPDGSGITYAAGTPYSELVDLDLYAQWTKEAISTLVINPNGGTWNGSSDVQSFTQTTGSTKNIQVPIPSDKSYTFIGWVREGNNGTISSLTEDAIYTYGSINNSTDTLIAQYERIQYEISYNANGGNGTLPSQQCYAGESVNIRENKEIINNTTSSEPAFKKSGYFFNGWNTSPDGTGTSYKEGDLYYPTGNLVLYAQWKASDINRTVTIIWNDRSNNIESLSNGVRPSNVTIDLIAEGHPELNQTVTVYGNNDVPAKSNEWTYEFKELKRYDENDNEIKYVVTEKQPNCLDSSLKYEALYSDDGWTITNNLKTADASYKIIGDIIWRDNNNAYNIRPDNIYIDLYRNEQLYDTIAVSTNIDNYEFTGIDKMDEHMIPYKYSIVERTVDGYSTTYSIDTESSSAINENGDMITTTILRVDIENTLEVVVKPITAGNVLILDVSYTNKNPIVGDKDFKTLVSLKQLETIWTVVDKENGILKESYGDYSGIEINVIVNKTENITVIPYGKYEISVQNENDYSFKDIEEISSNNAIFSFENGKYYVTFPYQGSEESEHLNINMEMDDWKGYSSEYNVENFFKNEETNLKPAMMSITHKHDWDNDLTIGKEATCTEDGYKFRKCKECTDVKDITIIAALEHEVVDGMCIRCSEKIEDIYHIYYESDSVNDEKEYLFGDEAKILDLEEPLFIGWSTDENSEAEYFAGDIIIVKENIDLYPVFEEESEETTEELETETETDTEEPETESETETEESTEEELEESTENLDNNESEELIENETETNFLTRLISDIFMF